MKTYHAIRIHLRHYFDSSVLIMVSESHSRICDVLTMLMAKESDNVRGYDIGEVAASGIEEAIGLVNSDKWKFENTIGEG